MSHDQGLSLSIGAIDKYLQILTNLYAANQHTNYADALLHLMLS